MNNRAIRISVFSILALIIGSAIAYWQVSSQDARVIKTSSRPMTEADKPTKIAGLDIGGPFTLSDQNGNKVTEKSYTDQYKLIYFGFTYCPAICPTELQKMRQVMNGLPDTVASTIQPLFITIDPERDTVAVMKDYVSLFHPRLIGLTGTPPQIDIVKKHYRIFAAKVPDETGEDYTMNHSSFTYLMSPENTLVGMYRLKDTADMMVKDIQSKIDLEQL